MKSIFKRILISSLFASSVAFVFSQEALKSTEEEYYDFLSLQGLVNRPTLNYRTLSDSEWELSEEARNDERNVWKNNNLGTKHSVSDNVAFKIYGPEWFNSYNTAAPYGQNDGALWQGKGYNTSFTAGARLEAYGFELTFKPQVSFSENKDFDYITPNYSGSTYAGKADTYGYYGVTSIDAPQRFGDSSFGTFDWGDTEIRYTWKTLTAGFGTQTIWLGPAQLNPIIHSNNAPSYPKIDVGFRKTSIYMPWTDWYLGDFEGRGWWGYLSESDYFDNDSSNDHNLITGLSFAWDPPYLTGLTLGLNRTMLSKWNDITKYSLFEVFVPGLSNSGGTDENDQRFSFTVDYKVPAAGLDIYLEWGRNDYSPGLNYIIRYPFHTQGYTIGGKKTINFSNKYKGELFIEITGLECSQDYDRVISWYSTFYAHHIITQGYTNGGQWLGPGIGTGGNSQYIGFKLYHPKGYWNVFFQRRNPDLDYTWFIDKTNTNAESSIRVMLDFGFNALYYFTPSISIRGGIVYTREMNPLNDNTASVTQRNSFCIPLSIKYNL